MVHTPSQNPGLKGARCRSEKKKKAKGKTGWTSMYKVGKSPEHNIIPWNYALQPSAEKAMENKLFSLKAEARDGVELKKKRKVCLLQHVHGIIRRHRLPYCHGFCYRLQIAISEKAHSNSFNDKRQRVLCARWSLQRASLIALAHFPRTNCWVCFILDSLAQNQRRRQSCAVSASVCTWLLSDRRTALNSPIVILSAVY